ncbi:MAG: hypothetical protein ACOCQP_02115 [Lentisphaeria bacterium]
MLENKEKLQKIDLQNVFTKMVQDLPWKSFRDILQTNQQLLKKLMLGGHRMEAKNRKRFEKKLIQEAERQNYTPEITSAIFAHWYPLQETIYKNLEDYFDSEEYKEHLKNNDLDENSYVLPQDKFEEFFDVKDVDTWRVLLCFSPLAFTEEQADQIINAAGSDEALLERCQELEAEIEELKQEKNKLASQNKDIRTRLKELNDEEKQRRDDRKDLRAQVDKLQRQLNTAKNENSKLQEQLQQSENQVLEQQNAELEEVKRGKNRLEKELERLRKTVSEWEEKYENQRLVNRNLEQKIKETEERVEETTASEKKAREEIDRAHHFADLILDNIDWHDLGRQLRLTPQMKRKFNSLIRSLNYEDDGSLSLGDALTNFWNQMVQQEKELISIIAESDTKEVENGNIEAFWQGLTDHFEDVTISLEARTILLQLLHEIFYRTLSMEELEKGIAPGQSSKKSRSSAT